MPGWTFGWNPLTSEETTLRDRYRAMTTRGLLSEKWIGPLVALVFSAVIGWFAFVSRQPVPFLDWFDLAVHEASHMLAAPLPRLGMFMAGSVGQVVFPLAMAWYFGIHRREYGAGSFCLAWAGTSAWDVSVYIADAPIQALPLVGGGQHDWAFILGPRGFDATASAASIARAVDVVGAMAVIAGMFIAAWFAVEGFRSRSDSALEPRISPAGDEAWAAAASLPFRHQATQE